jgi:hypothetical protein
LRGKKFPKKSKIILGSGDRKPDHVVSVRGRRRFGYCGLMLYRVDATVRGLHGNIEVLGTHEFRAEKLADAQAIADAWVATQQISDSGILRIVRAEMILSQRNVQVARWS